MPSEAELLAWLTEHYYAWDWHRSTVIHGKPYNWMIQRETGVLRLSPEKKPSTYRR